MEELCEQIAALEARVAALSVTLSALESSDALAMTLRILDKLPPSVLIQNCAVTVESPLRDIGDFLVSNSDA